MAVNGKKTVNYEFECNGITVEHTSDHLGKAYLYERSIRDNSFKFDVKNLDDVIDVLLALQAAAVS